MNKIIQEKMQISLPNRSDDNGGWVSDKSARESKTNPRKLNIMPPGQNIEQQRMAEFNEFGSSVSGGFASSGAGDVSGKELTATSVRAGYSKKTMHTYDDDYTNEHEDTFYLDVGGFVERGNTLDRL